MNKKRGSRVLEWGKSLLILLLAVSAVFLLGHTQISGEMVNELQNLFDRPTEDEVKDPSTQISATAFHPVQIVTCQNELRYGVQYSQDETDEVFSALSIVLTEALGSAGVPEEIPEREWRAALCSTGIYMEYLYPVPLYALSTQTEGDQEPVQLFGSTKRICVAADQADGVSLYYINEEDGKIYACTTTLSSDFHLDAAIADWAPNGAQFAFEVAGMETLEPYTLLTRTPQPVVYRASDPLLDDAEKLDQLLSALAFRSRGMVLDPKAGGQIVENNDSLRLSADGVVTFHTIGNEEYRFLLSGSDTRTALNYVQTIVEDTIGAWCGQARVCLSGIEETEEGLVITFQYSLNGAPVALPDGNEAARFMIRNGAITDFSLYLRSYTATEETSLVLPVAQAAAAMDALKADGKELTLFYQDSGGEEIRAIWIAA